MYAAWQMSQVAEIVNPRVARVADNVGCEPHKPNLFSASESVGYRHQTGGTRFESYIEKLRKSAAVGVTYKGTMPPRSGEEDICATLFESYCYGPVP
jgi:hypothetical protein